MADLRRHDQHHLSVPESEHIPGNAVSKAPHTQLSELVSDAAHAYDRSNKLPVQLDTFLGSPQKSVG